MTASCHILKIKPQRRFNLCVMAPRRLAESRLAMRTLRIGGSGVARQLHKDCKYEALLGKEYKRSGIKTVQLFEAFLAEKIHEIDAPKTPSDCLWYQANQVNFGRFKNRNPPLV